MFGYTYILELNTQVLVTLGLNHMENHQPTQPTSSRLLIRMSETVSAPLKTHVIGVMMRECPSGFLMVLTTTTHINQVMARLGYGFYLQVVQHIFSYSIFVVCTFFPTIQFCSTGFSGLWFLMKHPHIDYSH